MGDQDMAASERCDWRHLLLATERERDAVEAERDGELVAEMAKAEAQHQAEIEERVAEADRLREALATVVECLAPADGEAARWNLDDYIRDARRTAREALAPTPQATDPSDGST